MDKQLVQIGSNVTKDQLNVIDRSDMLNDAQASLFSPSTLCNDP